MVRRKAPHIADEVLGRVLPGSNRLRIAICAMQRTSVGRVCRPALVLQVGACHRTEPGATPGGIGREPAMRRSPSNLALTGRTK